MTLSLPQLKPADDVHTGDLTGACKMACALRRMGRFEAVIPTAMMRGSIFGRAVELMLDPVSGLDPATAVQDAVTDVRLQGRREGREFTDGAEKALPEVTEHVFQSLARLPEALSYLGGKEPPRIVGFELPMRGTVTVDGEPQSLATHLDILIQQKATGRHVVIDCKWREDAPTQAYLARNMQFAIMYRLMRTGTIKFPSGQWFTLESEAMMAWLHAPYLRPAGRLTHLTDPYTGEPFTLAKGQSRPIEMACRFVNHRPEMAAAIDEEIAQHVRMMRMGIWPTNPEPVRCQTCECEKFCPRFDTLN